MCPTDYQRPDPDALLAKVQAEERRASRGKLRIYFGASAGVGKTYAMLSAARKLQADGHGVIIGIIETHGRSETASLLEGLQILPLKTLSHREKTLAEFDIDTALAHRPELILVDELAHSNAAGSRHPKRWQDVEELLDAGIDVFTTVNVQHLESLNDVVGGITGIRVAETLPDTVFDKADEVVLVDIPADELLTRLKAGKVYQPQQAERASHNFFRKGNLIALRELALRRTADRLEGDVQAYRIEKSINAVWKTDSVLLACVGPRPGAEHIVRSTARLAGQLNAAWHAVYIETPQLQRLSSLRRERILKALKLAQDLGATTAVLSGEDIAHEIVAYARSHNLSKIVLGRGHSAPPWRINRLNKIAAYAPDIDLIQVGRASAACTELNESPLPTAANGSSPSIPRRKPQQWRYVWSATACVLTTLIATLILSRFDPANIVMLFLLTEMLIAVRFGRGPAVMAAFVNVAAFDFFFVPPRFTFVVNDFQYIVTFIVMLIVGLIVGQLAAGLRYRARVASHRESRARALYEFARELSGTLQTEQIFETTCTFVQHTFQAKAALLLPDAAGRLQLPSPEQGGTLLAPDLSVLDMGIAQWAFDHAAPAGIGTGTLPGSSFFYLPLIAPMRTRGILAIQPESRRWILIPEQRQQLDAFATLAAIALERVHYIEVAQDALIRMESERLRNSLLSALSHDLRTPLTSLVGLAESLVMGQPPLDEKQTELAIGLRDESMRLSKLVHNLLDMARLESGEVRLRLEWQSIEEIIGSSLKIMSGTLAGHIVKTVLPGDMPLVQFDAVLIERVLCNLLENAVKYTPAGSEIRIEVVVKNTEVAITVADNGPGFSAGLDHKMFDKFTRGETESATPGIGLGLAICRAIIKAHKGKIWAERSDQGGSRFTFSLPLGTPPQLNPEDREESVIKP